MTIDAQMRNPSLPLGYVAESRIGNWFLNTDIWDVHVVRRALGDLVPLIETRRSSYPVVLDAGCGAGRSLRLLTRLFRPRRLIGIDIEPHLIAAAARRTGQFALEAELKVGDVSKLDLPDESVDLVFCHQTFHHLVNQAGAISEFHRVLKPGGLLLFAESTRIYIESWIIRLLFRHPMDVQKTASEYLALIRNAGFDVRDGAISCPYLWWSQSDFGLRQRLFGSSPRSLDQEPLLNLVAVRC